MKSSNTKMKQKEKIEIENRVIDKMVFHLGQHLRAEFDDCRDFESENKIKMKMSSEEAEDYEVRQSLEEDALSEEIISDMIHISISEIRRSIKRLEKNYKTRSDWSRLRNFRN